MTLEGPHPRLIRVGRRVYRKTSQRDRRRKLEYAHPELRLSNTWLKAAGFEPGDLVYVTCPEPEALVITLARRSGAGGSTRP